MGCPFSRPPHPHPLPPSPSPSSSPNKRKNPLPLPSRPLDGQLFYYRYHALPESAPRYKPAYGRLTSASGKKRKADSVGTCEMDFVNFHQIRERPVERRLRVVNGDDGVKNSGGDGLKVEEERKGEEDEISKLYRAWMRVD